MTIGEFIAFTIGWNIIFESIVGSAAIARGLSDQVDFIINNKMSDFFTKKLPIDNDNFGPYIDVFAFVTMTVMTLLITVGMRQTGWVFKIFSVLNLLTILTILIAGGFQLDRFNWGIFSEDIPAGIKNGTGPDGGEGEFLPYGVAGVVVGASKCFFAFVGFDRIATIGDELKSNKKSSIPAAMILSIGIVLICSVLLSCYVTLMSPYYLLDDTAPILQVFDLYDDFKGVKWAVRVGVILGLLSSLLGFMVSYCS